jgi:UDP-N-acetylglucosamine transferase subunit ALG13
MIFLTVGTQLPFDRLVRATMDWHARNPGAAVFGQIGDSDLHPGFDHAAHLDMAEHERCMAAAEVVVSHVGMGTILTCVSEARPLIAMPRRAHLGEHRNDHQAATAAQLSAKITLCVVETAGELAAALARPRGDLVPRLKAEEPRYALSHYLRDLVGESARAPSASP